MNHNKNDIAIINKGNEDSYNSTRDIKSNKIYFGSKAVDSDACIKDKSIYYKEEKIIDLSDIRIKGMHNYENIMCATIATKQLGITNQQMAEEQYLYALPYKYFTEHKVRKYGAHGTSHKYVSARAIDMLGNPEHSKVIVCHLGNGASLSAVKDGLCVDTSMGFTPLAGVMMGTRSGDIDPSILPFVMKKEGLNIDEMLNVLNKQSGMLGVSGISSDSRDIEDAYKEGNEAAIRTSNLYAAIVAKYIGTYFVELGGCDAIAFTAGLGENAAYLRTLICNNIKEALGVELDEAKNNTRSGDDRVISTENSKVQIMIIPTNEEVMIARDTVRLLGL